MNSSFDRERRVELRLNFLAGELVETQFFCKLSSQSCRCIRGKSPGAFDASGTFQWTTAVKALCVLILRSRLSTLRKDDMVSTCIQGEKGSLASSLDFALSKEVNWLKDLFGVDSRGTLIAARVLLRTNPNRKRPGPVAISINRNFLPLESLSLTIDGNEEITEYSITNLIARIELSKSPIDLLSPQDSVSKDPNEEKNPLVA